MKRISYRFQGYTKLDQLPAELDNEVARYVLDQLVARKILDEHYQASGLSWSKRGYLARCIGQNFGISHVWKVMGDFWHCNSRSLRSGYNKSLDCGMLGEFMDDIRDLMR